MSSHQNLAELIDHAFVDSIISLVKKEEEVYSICIHNTNENNDISKSDN